MANCFNWIWFSSFHWVKHMKSPLYSLIKDLANCEETVVCVKSDSLEDANAHLASSLKRNR